MIELSQNTKLVSEHHNRKYICTNSGKISKRLIFIHVRIDTDTNHVLSKYILTYRTD